VEIVESMRARVDRLALGSAKSQGALRAQMRRVARALAAPLVLGRASRTVTGQAEGAPWLVCVGGPSVGGSGKTPVAIACAKALAAQGVRTAFVGHGYGARLGGALLVDAATPHQLAGDEARVAEAQLRPFGVPVLVARSRSRAVAAAAEHASVVVVDGPLETHPLVAALTVLACADADTGTLARLLATRADAVVPSGLAASTFQLLRGDSASPLLSLAGVRFGLITAIARPERAVAAFGHLAPAAHLALGNHARLGPRALAAARELTASLRLDAWVTTEKGPLLQETRFAGLPLHTLRHEVGLPPPALAHLAHLAERTASEVEVRPRPL